MFVIRQILKLIELLHKETGEKQLAAGFVLGIFMGLTPLANLFWLSYLVLLILFRFNIGAAMLSFGVVKLASFALDPVLDKLGVILLSSNGLVAIWTTFFHMPVVPFTRYNNSVVLGSVVFSILLSVPLFYLAVYLIRTYRKQVVARIQGTWIWKAWKASKLYSLYDKYQQFAG